MLFCAAIGCNSRHKKDSGVSLFRFPKDAGRRKAWTIYCRREDFSPTDNNQMCFLHFSKEQLDRDPEKLNEKGRAQNPPTERCFSRHPPFCRKAPGWKCNNFLPAKKAKRSLFKTSEGRSKLYFYHIPYVNFKMYSQSSYKWTKWPTVSVRKCTCYDVHT